MMDNVSLLLAVQELYLKTDVLTREVDQRKRTFETLLADAEARRRNLETLQSQVTLLETEREEMEKTLRLEEERLRKSRKKMNDLHRDYEVRAMQREIEATKRSNSELEETILAKMDQLENLKKSLTEQQPLLAQLEAEVRKAREELAEKEQEVTTELKRSEQERQDLERQIDTGLLARYKRIRDRRHPDALVAVSNYCCQGCFMNVPPQRVNEMMAARRIESCQSCQRLIYVQAVANSPPS